MGRRAVGVYAALVLIFTGMICRVYALSMGGALASAANTQSAFVLDVDNTRGVIYDCNLKPLVGTEVRKLAAVQPSPRRSPRLPRRGSRCLRAPRRRSLTCSRWRRRSTPRGSR